MKLILCIAVLLPFVAFSQFGNQDFGVWGSIGLDKKISKGLKLKGEFDIRTEDNSSSIKQLFGEFGAKYKVNKHFSGGAYWRPRLVNGDYGYEYQNRFHLDLTGKLKAGNLSMYLRSRTQQLFKPNENNQFYERVRIKVAMKLQDGLSMMIQDEFFFYINNLGGSLYDKNRFGVGMEYEINKDLAVTLKYLRITEVNTYYPLKMNVLSLNFSYSL